MWTDKWEEMVPLQSDQGVLLWGNRRSCLPSSWPGHLISSPTDHSRGICGHQQCPPPPAKCVQCCKQCGGSGHDWHTCSALSNWTHTHTHTHTHTQTDTCTHERMHAHTHTHTHTHTDTCTHARTHTRTHTHTHTHTYTYFSVCVTRKEVKHNFLFISYIDTQTGGISQLYRYFQGQETPLPLWGPLLDLSTIRCSWIALSVGWSTCRMFWENFNRASIRKHYNCVFLKTLKMLTEIYWQLFLSEALSQKIQALKALLNGTKNSVLKIFSRLGLYYFSCIVAYFCPHYNCIPFCC